MENIKNLGTSNLFHSTERGFAFMFLLCCMQEALNTNLDALILGKFPTVVLSPRWLALVEVMIVHVLIGNQDCIKRRQVENMITLEQLLTDRERCWKRFCHTYVF